MNGLEAKGACPFCDSGDETLRVGESSWRTLCCCANEEYGGDARGFLQSFLNCTADEAAHKLSNGNLPDPQPVEQAKLVRPPFFGIRQVLDRPDDKVWIHTLAAAVVIARELVPERVHIGLIQGRSWDDLGLPPARKCVLLPTNSDTARQVMDKLAIHLADAGHTVRLIDPSDQEPHWTLMDAQQSGWGHDEIMTWAKSRTRPGPKNDAAQQGRALDAPNLSILDTTVSATVTAAAASPASEALGGTYIAAPPPIAQPGPPTLTIVEGNTLRAPKQAEIDPDQLPAFSEFALAQRFADGSGLDWRYTAAWGLWAYWGGQRWVPDECKAITWKVKECCSAAIRDNLSDSTPAQRLKVGALKTINAVMGIACANPRIATTVSAWDADPMLLGTPSGVIDLRTGALLPGEREQMISKATGVGPAAGPHPWWDRVLARGHKDDAEVFGLIHRWCGYLLTGDTREERFLFIHGPGAGGKSKFLMVLSEILGDYRKTAKMESFTAKDKTEHSEEIARLAGARMVTATETEEGSRWNEARIKTLTGRDAIAARHMHKSTFEFQPHFKLIFIGNHRPALRAVGEEMRRRIDLIEWGGTIPEAERILDLSDKLRAEYPAILAWMIEGCLAWQREGLGKPVTVETATREYLNSEDTLGAWLEECTQAGHGSRSLSGDVYRSFKRWAEAAGEFVGSQKRLTQRLKDRGFDTVKSGQRYFVGFSLKASDNFEPDHAAWLPPD